MTSRARRARRPASQGSNPARTASRVRRKDKDKAHGARGNADGEGSWNSARELLEELQREGGVGLTPGDIGRFAPGTSAPGTEAWKQDFSRWDELNIQLGAALQLAESAAAVRLREQQAQDRLNAGATQVVPEQYRRLVEKYTARSAPGRRTANSALCVGAATVDHGAARAGGAGAGLARLRTDHRAAVAPAPSAPLTLRASVLLLLVACVLRPVRMQPAAADRDVAVPVLVDVSRSMGLADMDGRSRRSCPRC